MKYTDINSIFLCSHNSLLCVVLNLCLTVIYVILKHLWNAINNKRIEQYTTVTTGTRDDKTKWREFHKRMKFKPQSICKTVTARVTERCLRLVWIICMNDDKHLGWTKMNYCRMPPPSLKFWFANTRMAWTIINFWPNCNQAFGISVILHCIILAYCLDAAVWIDDSVEIDSIMRVLRGLLWLCVVDVMLMGEEGEKDFGWILSHSSNYWWPRMSKGWVSLGQLEASLVTHTTLGCVLGFVLGPIRLIVWNAFECH